MFSPLERSSRVWFGSKSEHNLTVSLLHPQDPVLLRVGHDGRRVRGGDVALLIRNQAAQIVGRMLPLRRLSEQLCERLRELNQALHHSLKYLRCYFALRKHGLFPQGKSSFHDFNLLNGSSLRRRYTKITYEPLCGFGQ